MYYVVDRDTKSRILRNFNSFWINLTTTNTITTTQSVSVEFRVANSWLVDYYKKSTLNRIALRGKQKCKGIEPGSRIGFFKKVIYFSIRKEKESIQSCNDSTGNLDQHSTACKLAKSTKTGIMFRHLTHINGYTLSTETQKAKTNTEADKDFIVQVACC